MRNAKAGSQFDARDQDLRQQLYFEKIMVANTIKTQKYLQASSQLDQHSSRKRNNHSDLDHAIKIANFQLDHDLNMIPTDDYFPEARRTRTKIAKTSNPFSPGKQSKSNSLQRVAESSFESHGSAHKLDTQMLRNVFESHN